MVKTVYQSFSACRQAPVSSARWQQAEESVCLLAVVSDNAACLPQTPAVVDVLDRGQTASSDALCRQHKGRGGGPASF